MFRVILLLVALLIAAPALGADEIKAHDRVQGKCTWWTICDEHNAASTCTISTDAAGNDAVISAGGQNSWTAFAHDSTDTSGWTAKIYGTTSTKGTAAGSLINTTGDLTPDYLMFSWAGIMDTLYVTLGGDPSSNGVTIVIKGCIVSE